MNIDELNEEQLRDIKRAFTIFILKVIKHSAIDFVRKEKLYNSIKTDKQKSIGDLEGQLKYLSKEINDYLDSKLLSNYL